MRFLVFLLLVAFTPLFSQVRPKPVNPRSNALMDVRPDIRQSPEARALLQKIERGILNGSADDFRGDFGKQVSMTIAGSESGYYSAGQAFLILQNYFSNRRPTQFGFTRLNDTSASPYATGRLSFVRRGSRESVQVYVSLTRQESQWVVTQFNIY